MLTLITGITTLGGKPESNSLTTVLDAGCTFVKHTTYTLSQHTINAYTCIGGRWSFYYSVGWLIRTWTYCTLATQPHNKYEPRPSPSFRPALHHPSSRGASIILLSRSLICLCSSVCLSIGQFFHGLVFIPVALSLLPESPPCCSCGSSAVTSPSPICLSSDARKVGSWVGK